jgi:hypothetical protein
MQHTHCVYQDGWVNSDGSDYALGDGITRPLRKLIHLCDDQVEAELQLAHYTARAKQRRGARVPGDGKMLATFACGEYDPLDFVGRQARDRGEWDGGKRFAILCRNLADGIEDNRRAANVD